MCALEDITAPPSQGHRPQGSVAADTQHHCFPDPQSSWPSVNTWIWTASHQSFQKGYFFLEHSIYS